MKGKVLEKAVLKEGWSLVSGPLTWKCEGKDLRKSGLERRLVLGAQVIYLGSVKKNRKSGLKRGVVEPSEQVFDMEM